MRTHLPRFILCIFILGFVEHGRCPGRSKRFDHKKEGHAEFVGNAVNTQIVEIQKKTDQEAVRQIDDENQKGRWQKGKTKTQKLAQRAHIKSWTNQAQTNGKHDNESKERTDEIGFKNRDWPTSETCDEISGETEL